MSIAEAAPMAAKRLQVVDATIAHVYRLAANMRRRDVEAAARIGRDARLALRLSYKSSAFYRRCALLGDDVLAMWGLGGDALSDVGFPWLITSQRAPAHRLALLKIGRAELVHMLAAKRLLVDYVDEEDAGAARLMRFFGFASVGHGPHLAGSGQAPLRFERRR